MRYLPDRRRTDRIYTFSLSLLCKGCSSLAVQDFNERLPKLDIKCGVYDGIYSTVHIAQPSESIVHFGGNLAFGAVGVQDMGDEKRQPTYDEYT